jgi:hypothetical protein
VVRKMAKRGKDGKFIAGKGKSNAKASNNKPKMLGKGKGKKK